MIAEIEQGIVIGGIFVVLFYLYILHLFYQLKKQQEKENTPK